MEDFSLNIEHWRKKRKLMFINIALGGFTYGLSLNIYFPTEYHYLKNTVKVENPSLIFGLFQAGLFVSGAFSSIIGSYYVDLTKNFREICLLEDTLNVIGNIMYSLYYFPYLIRARSKTAATSKMERFVIIVKGFQPLNIITKCSILDVAAVLDRPLLTMFEQIFIGLQQLEWLAALER